jgi:hypothetical protein
MIKSIKHLQIPILQKHVKGPVQKEQKNKQKK